MRPHPLHGRAPLFLCLLALLAAACGEKPRPGVPAENLLLVTFEGLRADHLSAFLYPRDTSHIEREQGLHVPDFDWIAESGVMFSSAYTPSGRLRPALASLMTGESPLTTGLLESDGTLAADIPTLAERLRARGMHTVAFLSPSLEVDGSGLDRGFESWDEDPDDMRLLRRVVTWLENDRPRDEPLFLWVHLNAGAALHAVGSFPGRPDLASQWTPASGPGRVEFTVEFRERLRSGELVLTEAEREYVIAMYDAEITRTNLLLWQLAEFYRHKNLQEELWEKTLVVLAGVGGCELGERPGAWHAAESLQEEVLHVPLVLRHPPSITGRRIMDTVVELSDLAPTVLELFDAADELPRGGRTLLPLIDSYVERPFEERPAVALRRDADGTWAWSARTPAYRLQLDGEGARLYELEEDPGALHDLASERRIVVAQLLSGVLARAAETPYDERLGEDLRARLCERLEAERELWRKGRP